MTNPTGYAASRPAFDETLTTGGRDYPCCLIRSVKRPPNPGVPAREHKAVVEAENHPALTTAQDAEFRGLGWKVICREVFGQQHFIHLTLRTRPILARYGSMKFPRKR